MYRLKPGIKTLLRRKKYTRIQLCEETGVNLDTARKYLNGSPMVTADFVIKLARIISRETNMNVTPLGLLENKFDRLEVRG